MPKLISLYSFFLISVFVSGCNNEIPSSAAVSDSKTSQNNLFVYIPTGSTQCNDDGLDPQESIQTLVGGGIDVLSTRCGFMTGFVFASVCGGKTGEIIAHEIRRVNLVDANKIGYDDISNLVDEASETGYVIHECTI